jgi:hypothetical protein
LVSKISNIKVNKTIKVVDRIANKYSKYSIGDSERLAMDVLSEGFGEFPQTMPTLKKKG